VDPFAPAPKCEDDSTKVRNGSDGHAAAADPDLARFEGVLLHTHWTSAKQRQEFVRQSYAEWAKRHGKPIDPDERESWVSHYEQRYAQATPGKCGAPIKIDPAQGADFVADAEAAEQRRRNPETVARADAVRRAVESDSPKSVLQAFRQAQTPGEFIDLQANLDMEAVIGSLDDWTAIQVGMLGPLRTGAAAMNRKRASYIVRSAAADSAAAEVFVMYMFQSMYTDDIRAVVEILAQQRQLKRALGRMEAVHEELGQRGIKLAFAKEKSKSGPRGGEAPAPEGEKEPESDVLGANGYHDKEQGALGGLWSGFTHGLENVFRREDFSMLLQRQDLPEPYRNVFDEVLDAEMREHFSPKNIILGGLDYMTFGVPGGLYNLVGGTARGVRDIAQGRFEEAGEELGLAVDDEGRVRSGRYCAPGATGSH
jgi:hypothetical protein